MGSTLNHEPLTGTENLSHTNLNSIFDDLNAGAVDATVEGTAGAALSELDFVFLDEDDLKWYPIDTDATGGVKCGQWKGVVVESGGIASAGTGTIKLFGLVDGFSGLTAWGILYASTTAGSYTQTKPDITDGGGQVALVELGFAVSTSQIFFFPGDAVYAERETLADDAELTIEHETDDRGRRRRVLAYVGDSYDEPLHIGSISGDSEEVGVEYGDGDQADEDTKTTFRNMTGSSADIVCMVVL